MNMLTLKWAEFLTAWTLASDAERSQFQEKHGPVTSPPSLLNAMTMNESAKLVHPFTHDVKGPVYYRDLDLDELRVNQKLVRRG